MIPRVFHRIWIGGPMPEQFRVFGESWLRCNPGWELREWGDEDFEWIANRDLWGRAAELMPPRLVHRFRSNIARIEILHRYGGVYLDCDFEALAPIGPHIEGVECFGVEEKSGLLATGIIGAVPDHRLFGHVIDGMADSVAARPGQPSWKANGQQHLARTAAKHGGLTLLPTKLFYPYHHKHIDPVTGNHPPVPKGAVAHHVWASRRQSVSVIVPWREPDSYRSAARGWLEARLAERSDWQVVWASDGLDGEFSRSQAIVNGVRESFGDIIVVSDGDVWCDGVEEAINRVRAGALWAIPHRRVHRLSEDATLAVLGGSPPEAFLGDAAAHDERPYLGRPAGGLVVMQRRVFEQCPPDVRFVGWGGEDDAWAPALSTLFGKPWRGDGPLWHLWHPPQARLSRSVGNGANNALLARYREANGNAARMIELVAETNPSASLAECQRLTRTTRTNGHIHTNTRKKRKRRSMDEPRVWVEMRLTTNSSYGLLEKDSKQLVPESVATRWELHGIAHKLETDTANEMPSAKLSGDLSAKEAIALIRSGEGLVLSEGESRKTVLEAYEAAK